MAELREAIARSRNVLKSETCEIAALIRRQTNHDRFEPF